MYISKINQWATQKLWYIHNRILFSIKIMNYWCMQYTWLSEVLCSVNKNGFKGIKLNMPFILSLKQETNLS